MHNNLTETKAFFSGWQITEYSFHFWVTVCKTVHPMPSDRCPVLSCPVCLSVCNFGVLWQTVGWIKMKLGTQVGLGPGHIVLDVDPAPPPKKGG